MTQLYAIPCMVFGGSATFGIERAGFKMDRVLEKIDEMDQYNGFHFVRNRPDIEMIKPSIWDTIDYMHDGIPENVDMVWGNPDCSGLSLVNRNASADSATNQHIIKMSDIISKINPKTFVIENAPALISIGFPILSEFINNLEDKFRFTIIRDFAGNHNVAMMRQRTMVVGWNRKNFEKIPQIYMKKMSPVTLKDVIGDMASMKESNLPNQNEYPHPQLHKSEFGIPYAVKEKTTINRALCLHLEEIKDKYIEVFNERQYEGLVRMKAKMDANKGYWDKSAAPTYWDGRGPSMTSMTAAIHPEGDRFMTTREFARLMGYPDDFVFYDGAKSSHMQCMAQGVPANFVQWIAEEVKKNLEGDIQYLSNSDIVFQQHGAEKYEEFDLVDFHHMDKLTLSKRAKNLTDHTESSLSLF